MESGEYQAFLESKRMVAPSSGLHVGVEDVHPSLFEFQAALVVWSVRKGRAALWADTGLGKTRCQVEWARLIGQRTLIIAPLSVARQTVREAAAIGVEVVYARSQAEAGPGVTITNYEMAGHFDAGAFGAVVCDESSIFKGLDGKTRKALTEQFAATPYRLCCTATPAPNDITELANHAEFLGVLRRQDMLAAFFVHDDSGWRLKGHATRPFYRWLASWAMACRTPSDLGPAYSDEGYVLPPLSIDPVWVDADVPPDEGHLFFTHLKGIRDRSRVRKSTLQARVEAAVALVQAAPAGEKWVIWCGLNEEQDTLAAAFGDACVSVHGSLPLEEKVQREALWREGNVSILLTKASVLGWGMNWQHCARMAFVGLSDSWEAYYQCIRRCYRFGQERPVTAAIVLSRAEEGIYANVMHKETEARAMSEQLISHMGEFERAEISGMVDQQDYLPAVPMRLPAWLLAS